MLHSTGICLINVGSPKEAHADFVSLYLKEFLMDPYIIDIPFIFRWILVYLMIVPKRAHQSAEAYQKVWMNEGSPLLVFSKRLSYKLQNELASNYLVSIAMRYQEPSIKEALETLIQNGAKKLIIIPLYPQFADATVTTTINKCEKFLQKYHYEMPRKYFSEFYFYQSFIQSITKMAQDYHIHTFDHVLMSFHGLPERQIRKADTTKKHCLKNNNCCDSINEMNKHCYRAQAYQTANLIAKELGLANNQYSVSFQSRLGKTKWIEPYTDKVLQELPKSGVKKLAVICPSFVIDCLETLEEIGMRGKELFLQNGGESFCLIPSLNDSDVWVKGLSEIVKELSSDDDNLSDS